MRFPPTPFVMTAMVALLSTTVASAEDASSESPYFQELPMVLSATRLEQPLTEAPTAVTVLDRELIRASGARSLADLMRLVPGFQVAWPRGNQAVVSYHGLSDNLPRRMQILVDGRAEYQPLIGGPDWNDLPVILEDIARIEVVRGTNASTYGSNSFLGVINIITQHASASHGTYARYRLGNNGTSDIALRHGAQLGLTDVRLSANYSKDDGFASNDTDGYRIPSYTLRTDTRLGVNDSLMVNAGYAGGERDNSIPVAQTVSLPYTEYPKRQYLQLRWQHDRSPRDQFSVQLFKSGVDTGSFVTGKLGNVSVAQDLGAKADRLDFEFQHNRQFGQDVRVVWGVGDRLDEVRSSSWLRQSDTYNIHVRRLFANAEWRVARQLTINAGTMLEDHDLAGKTNSPRIAFNYLLAPGHAFRMSAARAYRSPFAPESDGHYVLRAGALSDIIISTFPGNKPEALHTVEAGYVGHLDSVPAEIDLRIFHEFVDDILTPVTTEPCPYGPDLKRKGTGKTSCLMIQNSDQARMRGAEAHFRYNLSRHSRLMFNYAYMDIAGTDVDRNYLYSRSAPRNSYSLVAMVGSPANIQASAIYYWVDRMTWMGYTTLRTLPRYERLDARLAKSLTFGSDRIELAITGQNLLGKYQEFENDPSHVFDKRVFVSVAIDHK